MKQSCNKKEENRTNIYIYIFIYLFKGKSQEKKTEKHFNNQKLFLNTLKYKKMKTYKINIFKYETKKENTVK